MPLPGYVVDLVDSPPVLAAPTATGPMFAVGRATTAAFSQVYSLDQVIDVFGARDPASPLYDSLETYFREGGFVATVAAVDMAGIDADIVAALAEFDKGLGPGQISAPGITTSAVQLAVMAKALATGRVAVLDGSNTAVAATLATQASGLTGHPGDRFSAMFAPWDIIPGLTAGTTRTVPSSARICGNIARNDGQGKSPNKPAAGVLGMAQYAQSLSQLAFSDANRQTLNEAGVNVSRMVYGGVRTYGWRSLADQDTDAEWSWFNNSRLIMAILAELDVVAENFEFSEDDGAMVNINKFGGEIIGNLTPWWVAGSLFGATANDAFSVNVGPSVNTDVTLSNGELHAQVGLRCSKFSEQVFIDVAKVPITQSLT